MLGFLIAIALVLALAFSARRLWLRRRLARLLRAMPGGTPETALPVHSFAGIDEHLRGRRCFCGAGYAVLGEGSRMHDGRRLRLIRLECGICEREADVYFDVTELFH